MLGVTNLPAFITATIGIVLLPGPGSLFIFALSQHSSAKKTFKGIAGIITADSFHMLCVAFGVAGLLKLYPTLFHLIKTVGSLYLGYLGLRMIWGGVSGYFLTQKTTHPKLPKAGPTKLSKMFERPYRGAVMTNLLNPKAIFFFLSFFVQFVDPAYPNPAVPFLFQALILHACSFLYLLGLSYMGRRLVPFFQRQPLLSMCWILAIGGLFFTYGLLLLTAT